MLKFEENHFTTFLLPYKQAVEELVLKFKGIKIQMLKAGEYSYIESVEGRVKSVNSIFKKANKYNYSLEEIEYKIADIAGIRIICQFEEDIYEVLNHIKNRSDMKIVITKNYIENPKTSGYKSVHLIIEYEIHTPTDKKKILAEIQIRTLAMNFWATIEHSLNYKYKGEIPKQISNQLLKAANNVEQLDKEMSFIKEEVMHAQKLFRSKSEATNKILSNISLLNSLGHLQIVEKYIKIFTQISENDDALQLLFLSRELEDEIKKLTKQREV